MLAGLCDVVRGALRKAGRGNTATARRANLAPAGDRDFLLGFADARDLRYRTAGPLRRGVESCAGSGLIDNRAEMLIAFVDSDDARLRTAHRVVGGGLI